MTDLRHPGIAPQPLQERITSTVLDRLSRHPDMRDTDLKRLIARVAASEMAGLRLPFSEQQLVVERLFNAMRGYDVLQPLMEQPAVTEIMVNGPDQVFYERDGQLHTAEIRFSDAPHLQHLITHLFSLGNRSVSRSVPVADVRLPDGSRANAVLPPVAPDGPILTIRKFTGVGCSMDSLLEQGTLTSRQAAFLKQAVRQRLNLFICGGTGVGKTTLLNILAGSIAPAERVVTMEDSAELSLPHLPNRVRLEVKTPGPDGTGGVSMTDLVRTALRLRPDRLIMGEVRGPEAADLLQALHTGHRGSLSTGHGNSCTDMLVRLAMLARSGSDIPYPVILRQIGRAIDLVLHMVREPDGRRRVGDIRRVVPDVRNGYRVEPLEEDLAP